MPRKRKDFTPGEQITRLSQINPADISDGFDDYTTPDSKPEKIVEWLSGVNKKAFEAQPHNEWLDGDIEELMHGRGIDDGITGALRHARTTSERIIGNLMKEAADPDFEVNKLPDNLRTPASREQLAEIFPSGNFLFHGTTVNGAIQILESGQIKSSSQLMKERPLTDEQISSGGVIGVSFSLNQIVAVPGDYRHMVGFVAPPEALSGNYFIPFAAAPYEVQLTGPKFDKERWRKIDTRAACWRYVMMELAMYGAHATTQELHDKLDELPFEIARRKCRDGEITSDDILALTEDEYEESSDKFMLNFDESCTTDTETSILAAIIQKMIEEGDAKSVINREVTSFAELQPIEILLLGRAALPSSMDQEAIADSVFGDVIEVSFKDYEKAITTYSDGVKVDTSELVFVCPDRDLAQWQAIIAKQPHKPKGIIVYDARQVRTPNFVMQRDDGDQDALSQSLRSQIPENDQTVDWLQWLPNGELKMEKGQSSHLVANSHTLHAQTPTF
jgi:hypothetical protein